MTGTQINNLKSTAGNKSIGMGSDYISSIIIFETLDTPVTRPDMTTVDTKKGTVTNNKTINLMMTETLLHTSATNIAKKLVKNVIGTSHNLSET